MRGQGGAGFIREHIAKNGHAYVGGYAIGSEGNIPAFDYSEKDSEGVWMAQKQWLYYSLWGRLLYDPTTPDTTFAAMFDARYHLSGSPAAAGGQRPPRRLARQMRAARAHGRARAARAHGAFGAARAKGPRGCWDNSEAIPNGSVVQWCKSEASGPRAKSFAE